MTLFEIAMIGLLVLGGVDAVLLAIYLRSRRSRRNRRTLDSTADAWVGLTPQPPTAPPRPADVFPEI